jgi:hypothetical protein
MAFYKTHEKNLVNGIKFELEQDLVSAPLSVKVLPLLKNSRKILFEQSTDLGIGVYSYSFEASFANIDNLRDVFYQSTSAKIKLIIKDGSTTLFYGYPQLSTLREGFIGVITPFTVTFLDGIFRAQNVNITRISSGLSIYSSVEEIVRVICNTFGLHGNSLLIAHKWVVYDNDYATTWTPSTARPTQLARVFANIVKWESIEAKYIDVIKDLCYAFQLCLGFSYLAGRYTLIDMTEGRNLAWDALSISGFVYPGSPNPVAQSIVSQGIINIGTKSYIDRDYGYGKIAVQILDRTPVGAIEDTSDIGKNLREFTYSIPFDTELWYSDGNDGLGADDDSLSFAALCKYWKRTSAGSPILLDALHNSIIDELYGDDNFQVELEAVDGLIDPILPFRLDVSIDGQKWNMRARKGEWDLLTKKSKLTAFPIGVFVSPP